MPSEVMQCPYLDTIDRYTLSYFLLVILFHLIRGVLDFDFEKLCSVSLSHINVYACMVCGKYFQVFNNYKNVLSVN